MFFLPFNNLKTFTGNTNGTKWPFLLYKCKILQYFGKLRFHFWNAKMTDIILLCIGQTPGRLWDGSKGSYITQVMSDTLILMQRPKAHSAACNPSDRWPVCAALWQHLMCPWPFGSSKLSVKWPIAKRLVALCLRLLICINKNEIQWGILQ